MIRGRLNRTHFLASGIGQMLMVAALSLLVGAVSGCQKGGRSSMNASATASSELSGSSGVSVGRLTLQAPSVSKVWFQKVKVSDVELSLVPLSNQAFAAWAVARRASIAAGTLDKDGNGALIRAYDLPNKMPATLFVAIPNSEFQRLEAYRPLQGAVLVGTTMGLAKELALSEQLLVSVLGSFKAESAPYTAHSGFAIDGGVIDSAFNNNESANATAALHLAGSGDDPRSQPKVDIATEVFGNAAPSTLPDRMRRARESLLLMQAESPGLRSTTLRSGPRTVGGLAGQEYVTLLHDPEVEKDSFSAEFEFGGEANNPVKPYLQIRFAIPPYPAAPDRAVALGLWDSLLNSVRFH